MTYKGDQFGKKNKVILATIKVRHLETFYFFGSGGAFILQFHSNHTVLIFSDAGEYVHS